MKSKILVLLLVGMSQFFCSIASAQLNFDQYPNVVLSNKEVKVKVFLPDSENGLYRATRFDNSSVIGSVQYKGHEYFGYHKDTHDPLFAVDILGPAEGYKTPGLGYDEAKPGGQFIRIGVGVLEKDNAEKYNYMTTFKVVDYGKWQIKNGKDWIEFTHTVSSDNGYGYIYKKTIKLTDNGFTIEHKLKNSGVKAIETDQYSHNFFMIDNEKSGPSFNISYPFTISSDSDLKGLMEFKDNNLYFIKYLENTAAYVEFKDVSKKVEDNQFTVTNKKSGAGVTFSLDKPLFRVAFWANKNTLCPENYIQLSAAPGEEEAWTSSYKLFVK